MTSGNDNKKERDALSGIETTGHEWDGLKELNNPAPRWWLWVFVVTIVWSVGYWIVYPAWPTLTGHTAGKYGWTQYSQLKESQGEIIARRGALQTRMHEATLDQIRHDPELYAFARAGGAAAFKENCAACHGTGAAGAKGYPNLNDDDWIWGGTLDQIYTTIRAGVRSGHADERVAQMPAFGKDGLLNAGQVADVVEYVGKLHLGDKAEKTESFARGQTVFAENCASCHGAGGEGSIDMGAPRLNDEIWLYGGDAETLHTTVSNARAGIMPSWDGRLPGDTLKALAVYVHSLGGGK